MASQAEFKLGLVTTHAWGGDRRHHPASSQLYYHLAHSLNGEVRYG